MRNKVSLSDMKDFDTSYKIGLIGTTDEKGDPHISLISTLMAKSETEMMMGKFIVGESKKYLLDDPKVGFLIMSLQKDFWVGRMDYTHFTTMGKDYEHYNQMPLFRYNTYFGIDSVYYFDLKDISDKRKLDMFGVVVNSLMVMLNRWRYAGKVPYKALTPWATQLMKKLGTLAFISYKDEEGYPVVLPCIQLQAADESTLVLTNRPYGDELNRIPAGARVAVYGANLQFETVLMKGRFSGFKGGLGSVTIDRVYNSMPPKHGYIWELE